MLREQIEQIEINEFYSGQKDSNSYKSKIDRVYVQLQQMSGDLNRLKAMKRDRKRLQTIIQTLDQERDEIRQEYE